ncbi:asparagine synthase [Methylobacterium sp. Leaf456]|uniref:asparagine synthase (glutamine-hydrolyzing) n=1 Tax=Methylobacterium sp. Leaf456 TaxID=1736382 RepID=UPI0006FD7D93|nr:asparagine synthase (glutamine-hydrolyzing) [Methylobacterium sp. Leaf456]KQT59904.1 asparagine synthase [Methylobacterium sp. Leaf456]
MCGVVGYVGDPGPEESSALLRGMCEALRHRGPDDEGVMVLDGAGLGHTRLSIVDLAGGHQPMGSEDGQVVVSFNGEVFNFVELRRELEARGRRFRTTSDTEVLLQLYEEFGPDCVEKLNGDFAFAIWDARHRRMVLARDRIGVRPLFLTRHRGLLLFASEIKALLSVPGVEAEIDPVALDQTFTLWAPIPPRTAFKGIEELPPAHMLIVEDGRESLRSYWDLAFPPQGVPAPARPERELRAEVRLLLEDATAIRMRSDVPVGAYLSGGLDSSAVAALAARRAPAGLNTFSVTFDSAEHDESAFQAVMAKNLGTRHHAVACDGGAIADAFPAVVAHAERPILRTAPAPLFLLSRLVRESGMKVVLTGEGADEVFAGYDLFKEAKLRRFCARQPESRRRPQLLRRLYPYLPGLQQQTPESLAAFFGSGADPLDDPLYSHRPRLRGTAAAKMFFGADLRASLGGYDAAEELVSRLPDAFRAWHPLHQAQYLETRFLLPGYILSSQGDRMAMAHGVEGRFPFLDHRLIELAATIPPAMKLRGLREKHILREAVRDCVPAAILDRPKQPYRAPDSAAFFSPGAPDTVSALMEPDAVRRTGLFNPAAVARLADKCRGGKSGGFRDNVAFVGILSTQLWHRAFVERRASEAPPRSRASAI